MQSIIDHARSFWRTTAGDRKKNVRRAQFGDCFDRTRRQNFFVRYERAIHISEDETNRLWSCRGLGVHEFLLCLHLFQRPPFGFGNNSASRNRSKSRQRLTDRKSLLALRGVGAESEAESVRSVGAE